jgi:hypothetical protein
MNARTMNPKAVVAAAMMMVAAVTVSAASAGSSIGGLGHAVATRVVMKYAMGAWTAPAAVVLKSPADWNAWNADMVARGMAVGAEMVPANVDWKHEALLVVTLGECSRTRYALDLASCDRMALHTDVSLAMSCGQGAGTYPCVVVAMPKQDANSVRLSNGAAAGLPTSVPVYSPIQPANGMNAATEQVAASWGEVKDAYRQ